MCKTVTAIVGEIRNVFDYSILRYGTGRLPFDMVQEFLFLFQSLADIPPCCGLKAPIFE